jgi:hypothetical protein
VISKEECMKIILQEVPEFDEHWQAHLKYWGDEEAGLCNDMSEFSKYAADLIQNGQFANLPVVFDVAERLMVEGDNEVKDAVATCFLENLLNIAGTEQLDASKFVDLLGPESRAYCKAWDEFTGVYTEGL